MHARNEYYSIKTDVQRRSNRNIQRIIISLSHAQFIRNLGEIATQAWSRGYAQQNDNVPEFIIANACIRINFQLQLQL